MSDSEKEKILLEANSAKNQELWHADQRTIRQAEIKEQNERLAKLSKDPNYYYKLIKTPSLILTDYIKALCFFFASDTRFETDFNYSFQKGLWVRGLPGRGKTYPLISLQTNASFPFRIHSMITIAQTIHETGEYHITDFLKVIDDVGSEQSLINHFGTKINWFKDFIEVYYAAKEPFNQLIITTNLDFDEVEKMYGFRVRSRIKEMFNIIDVQGKDLRK